MEETNEVFTNDEVIDTAEELVSTDSGKGIKVAAGIGLAALVGGLLWHYAIKPAIAKAKAKKNQVPQDIGYDEFVDEDASEE